MILADDEKAMLDGTGGVAKQKAMELLVRYAEALGAERFVDTRNVAGVPGSSTLFLRKYFEEHGGDGSFEAVFSLYDLDAGEVMPVPAAAGQLLPSAGRNGSGALVGTRDVSRGHAAPARR